MILRSGHALGDTFYIYVHQCPGANCSVERWIWWKANKRRFNAAALAKEILKRRKSGDKSGRKRDTLAVDEAVSAAAPTSPHAVR